MVGLEGCDVCGSWAMSESPLSSPGEAIGAGVGEGSNRSPNHLSPAHSEEHGTVSHPPF